MKYAVLHPDEELTAIYSYFKTKKEASEHATKEQKKFRKKFKCDAWIQIYKL